MILLSFQLWPKVAAGPAQTADGARLIHQLRTGAQAREGAAYVGPAHFGTTPAKPRCRIVSLESIIASPGSPWLTAGTAICGPGLSSARA
jgi:hypothetical protein